MIGNTLYIIGNGFDRFHGLATSVDDFKRILSTKQIYNEIASANDVFDSYGVNWGGFEEDLSYINLDEIEEQHLEFPDYLSDRESDRDGVILNMEMFLDSLKNSIDESLKEMVETANKELETIDKNYLFPINQNDAIINFNYTSTLEKLYDLPININVLHIHGKLENGNNLVIGYKDKKYDIKDELPHRDTEFDNEYELYSKDYYVECQKSSIISFYEKLQKPFQIDSLKKFLSQLENITKVVVMGHSMSNVDSEYMETIEELLKPNQWMISQFNNDPSESTLSKYSFYSKVELFSLSDLIYKD